mmetsp:Transcript_42707/g.90509  ORF Transcript_42707/g.90509 Transcript_42707/m.90509 type:complete len:442 (-) Transcript_42707:197-1522(-)
MRQRREPTIHHGCSGGRDVVNTECEQSALLAQPIQLVCRPYLALVDHHSGSRAAGDWSLRSSPADQWPLWLRSFSLGARPRHPIAFFERGRPVLRDAGNQRRRWLQRRVAARHAVRPGASSGSSTHKSVDMLRDQGPVLSLVRLVRRLESLGPLRCCASFGKRVSARQIAQLQIITRRQNGPCELALRNGAILIVINQQNKIPDVLLRNGTCSEGFQQQPKLFNIDHTRAVTIHRTKSIPESFRPDSKQFESSLDVAHYGQLKSVLPSSREGISHYSQRHCYVQYPGHNHDSGYRTTSISLRKQITVTHRGDRDDGEPHALWHGVEPLVWSIRRLILDVIHHRTKEATHDGQQKYGNRQLGQGNFHCTVQQIEASEIAGSFQQPQRWTQQAHELNNLRIMCNQADVKRHYRRSIDEIEEIIARHMPVRQEKLAVLGHGQES